jgi:hypothetical protein
MMKAPALADRVVGALVRARGEAVDGDRDVARTLLI